MNNLSTRSLAILALGTTLAAGAAAQPAYFKRSLPDYDQRRSTLPGAGNMFCVPTAYVDLFKFMSFYGLPDMDRRLRQRLLRRQRASSPRSARTWAPPPTGGTGGNAAYNAATVLALRATTGSIVHDQLPLRPEHLLGTEHDAEPRQHRRDDRHLLRPLPADLGSGPGPARAATPSPSPATTGASRTKKLLVSDPAKRRRQQHGPGPLLHRREEPPRLTAFVNSGQHRSASCPATTPPGRAATAPGRRRWTTCTA